MTANKNIVELIHLCISVNVSAKKLAVGENTGSEIMALYQNVVILINHSVAVETPKGLSKKQKDLLEEFKKTMNDKNHAKRKSFFDKFKK